MEDGLIHRQSQYTFHVIGCHRRGEPPDWDMARMIIEHRCRVVPGLIQAVANVPDACGRLTCRESQGIIRSGNHESLYQNQIYSIMEIVREKTTVERLQAMAEGMFGNLVKAVVDVQRRLIAVDAELHADEETLLLEDGSRQRDLWGINIYPEMGRGSPDFIEFDSLINLRPAQNNRSRGVEDAETRDRIISVVDEWIS